MAKAKPAGTEIREFPMSGLLLSLSGGGFVLLFVIIKVVMLVDPPKKEELPDPKLGYMLLAGSIVAIVIGLIILATAKVLMRLERERLVLPRFGVAIPW